MNGKRFLLWDLPTRLFHWTLALCVVAYTVTRLIVAAIREHQD